MEQNQEIKNELRDIFDYISDSVMILDKDARFIDCNVSALRLTGYTREELLTMNVTDFLFEEDFERAKEYFKSLKANGYYEGFISKIRTKNGDIRIIDVNSRAYFDAEGNFSGSRDILRDITDRKRMESALIESEYKFRTIIEYSDAVIFMIDLDGIFSLSEGKALRLLDLKPGDVVGMSVYDIYRDFPDILLAFESARDGKHINILLEIGEIYFQSFFTPFINSEGEISGVIGTAIDVTGQVRREKILDEARIKAEEADLLKSNFLANMSHEIRTPMNAILGFSSLLGDDDLDKASRDNYIRIINAKGHELLNLLTDLIDISKIESGNVSTVSEHFTIRQFIDEIIENTRQVLSLQLHSKNIKVLAEYEAGTEKMIAIGDTGRVRQILNNLIQNAIKFTDEGEIRVGYTAGPNGFVRFFVSDTGIGIPYEKQGLVFERFRQVQETLTRNHSGTGLGLYIAKTLVELMGGTIQVESVPGKGSTFSFTLSRGSIPGQDSGKLQKIHNIYEAKNILRGKKILIVEDEESNFEYLEILLRKHDAKIKHATDGESALHLLETAYKPDIVLMDIGLPGISGLETTRLIKERYSDLPVIAQTAHAFNNDRNEALAAGCDDYIPKPININELVRRLVKFL